MFFDSHCHLNFDCFNSERTVLMNQLALSQINKVIIPGTDSKRWEEIIQLAYQYEMIYFGLGLHPHFLNDFEDDHLIQLKGLLALELKNGNAKCIALGEIGLDKLIDTDMSLQEKVFIEQLNIAQSLCLPVILHVVKTQSRVLALLKQCKFTYGGVYHAFSGSEEIANEFIKLGFKLGIGGVITYPTANKTRKTLSKLALDCVVLETDAPDMPIFEQQSKNNSPLNVVAIFNALCDLRGETTEIIEHQLYLNTCSLFSINHD